MYEQADWIQIDKTRVTVYVSSKQVRYVAQGVAREGVVNRIIRGDVLTEEGGLIGRMYEDGEWYVRREDAAPVDMLVLQIMHAGTTREALHMVWTFQEMGMEV